MPVRCPKCNTTSITAKPLEADGDNGYQEVQCDECQFAWIEIWNCTSWYPEDDESKAFKPDEKYTEVK